MLLRLLEDACDALAHRIAVEQSTDRQLSPQELTALAKELIRTKGLHLRSRSRDGRQVVLTSPGKIVGNMRQVVPKLRYRLALRDDNCLRMEVFEFLFCRSKTGPQAQAVQQLCEQHLEALSHSVEAIRISRPNALWS